MLKNWIFCALLACTFNTQANEVFAKADINAGKALVNQHCISCHASSFGGDGSAIYTRENRLVKSSKGLLAQVRNCNTMLGLKWFEDEELNVAGYLNQNYYKFER
jgi:cytochrome c553